MPKFNYVALDARGQESTGLIEASSTNEAVGQLRQAGYFPTSVSEDGKGPSNAVAKRNASAPAGKAPAASKKAVAAPKVKGPKPVKKGKIGGKVKQKTLMIFTRQLATLIDAGLPLLRGLTVLEKQERDPGLKATTAKLAESVQGGSTFSESLAQHPKIFNKLFINMVKAGELGGVLEIVLIRLAEFQEKAQKVKNKVKAAMIYPIVVLCIAVTIVSFLTIFIIPKFEQIFKDMLNGKPLPALTQWVLDVSHLALSYWYLIIGAVALIVFGYSFAISRPAGRAAMDRLVLGLPMFGDLVRKSSISRFARTLGTLVTSGVPILQALNITRDTAGNQVIANAISKVHDSVKEGESIVQPLEASSGIFPPMVISMIDVGEETGQLPEMLLKVAEVYDDEVDNAVAGLTAMMEPVMIVFLAVIVGTIVVALFLPLVSIIQNLGGGGGGG
ncbi:MAG: type II secretion system F family protein [Verrucomicrobia bacterium]|nr:type II secretion system F family protein [Verrucomicrobiota bacterium]MBV9656664.1 type II secretion system F family protein [Verrucomicrobiota bacterium]